MASPTRAAAASRQRAPERPGASRPGRTRAQTPARRPAAPAIAAGNLAVQRRARGGDAISLVGEPRIADRAQAVSLSTAPMIQRCGCGCGGGPGCAEEL